MRGTDVLNPDLENLYAEAERLAGLGGFGIDLKTEEAVWTEGMFRLHGVVPGSEPASTDLLLERTHPADRARMAALLENVLRDPAEVPESGISTHYRALCGGGEVREVVVRGRIEHSRDGEPVRFIAAAQHMTAIRRGEPTAASAPRQLTDRETEVLKLAAAGNSGPRIAERLYVSPSTIKTHFEHIYEKLGVGDRTAAVAHALRVGLIR